MSRSIDIIWHRPAAISGKRAFSWAWAEGGRPGSLSTTTEVEGGASQWSALLFLPWLTNLRKSHFQLPKDFKLEELSELPLERWTHLAVTFRQVPPGQGEKTVQQDHMFQEPYFFRDPLFLRQWEAPRPRPERRRADPLLRAPAEAGPCCRNPFDLKRQS